VGGRSASPSANEYAEAPPNPSPPRAARAEGGEKKQLVGLIEAAEDAVDARVASEIKRRLATGEEELISAEMVDRMIDGENKLLLWREHRGMSAKELAEATGLAAPYITQLETGKREGSIETFKKIATACRVGIDDIA
jgi:DNA-binding XRE family transcriptional regulator